MYSVDFVLSKFSCMLDPVLMPSPVDQHSNFRNLQLMLLMVFVEFCLTNIKEIGEVVVQKLRQKNITWYELYSSYTTVEESVMWCIFDCARNLCFLMFDT